MARSMYIYTVMQGEQGPEPVPPVAAFTVKHELRSYLERHGAKDQEVWRQTDGGGQPVYLCQGDDLETLSKQQRGLR